MDKAQQQRLMHFEDSLDIVVNCTVLKLEAEP